MSYGRLVHVGETLIDLQTLGCELHENAYGYSALLDPLAVIRG